MFMAFKFSWKRKPHELCEILNPMKINIHIVFSMLIQLRIPVDPTRTGNAGMLLLERFSTTVLLQITAGLV